MRLVGCLFHETACTRGRGNSFLVLPCLALPCSCIAFGLPCLLPFITLCFALPCLALPCPGLAWLDLAWLGLAWLSAWLGLAGLGRALAVPNPAGARPPSSWRVFVPRYVNIGHRRYITTAVVALKKKSSLRVQHSAGHRRPPFQIRLVCFVYVLLFVPNTFAIHVSSLGVRNHRACIYVHTSKYIPGTSSWYLG